jgi:hypothetical protein
MAHYCDAKCQVAHFPHHKKFCIEERDQILQNDATQWWCEYNKDVKFPSAALCANFLPDVSHPR